MIFIDSRGTTRFNGLARLFAFARAIHSIEYQHTRVRLTGDESVLTYLYPEGIFSRKLRKDFPHLDVTRLALSRAR